MKRLFLLFFLLPLLCPLSAQIPPGGTRLEAVNQGQDVVIRVADKSYPGFETIVLTLDQLENCNTSAGTSEYVVRYDGQTLCTLRPVNDAFGVNYHYTYRIVRGIINPHVDTTFVYRMPCSSRKAARVGSMWEVLDIEKKLEYRQHLGFYFYGEKGDTVYAARRGIVTRIERTAKPGPEEPQVIYTTESSKIFVEHPDGSFASYVCLDGNNLFVGEGDEVFPSTPLALMGSYDGKSYQACLQLYWKIVNPDKSKREREPYDWRYFFPPFATTEGAVVPVAGTLYTPLVNRELITREMTRKEQKRWAASHADR